MPLSSVTPESLPTTQPKAEGGTWKFTAGVVVLLIVVALTRLPFLLPGYGPDPDGWLVVLAARHIAETGTYIASRFPAHPVQEMVSAFLWQGGPLVLNSLTALMSLVAVLYFVLALKKLGSRDALLAGLALAMVPVIYVNSTVTMDYLWELAFIMAAFYAVLSRRPLAAGVLLGLAVGCRVSSAALILPFALLLTTPGNWRKSTRDILTFAVLAMLFGVIFFSPIISQTGLKSFQVYFDQTPTHLWLRRLTTDLWGVIGCIALLGTLFVLAVGARKQKVSSLGQLPREQMTAWLTVLAIFLLIFIYIPYESAYLMPLVPFTLLILGRLLPRPAFQAFCIALVISPFLFALRTANRPPGPPLLSKEILGSRLCLYLPGAVLDNRHIRQEQQEYVGRILSFTNNLRKSSIVILGTGMSNLVIQYAFGDKSLVPHPLYKVMAGNLRAIANVKTVDDPRIKILFFFIDLIFPLFAGYLLCRSGKVSKESVDRLMLVSILVVAPALAIISFWGITLKTEQLWLPVLGLVMQVIPGVVGFHQAKRRYPTDHLEQGSYVLASTLSNRGTIGTLSVFILYGEAGYAFARLVMLLGDVFLYTFCFPMANFFYESHRGGTSKRPPLAPMLLNKNMIPVLGILIGLALNFSGQPRVDILSRIFPYLVHVSAWFFLLPVGYVMDFGEMKQYWAGIWELFGLKFVLTPALIFLIAVWLLHWHGPLLGTVLVLACSPTAINAVITAKLHKLNVHLAMTAVVATTAVYLLIFFPLLFILGGKG